MGKRRGVALILTTWCQGLLFDLRPQVGKRASGLLSHFLTPSAVRAHRVRKQNCAPGEIRTPNLLLRSTRDYPDALWKSQTLLYFSIGYNDHELNRAYPNWTDMNRELSHFYHTPDSFSVDAPGLKSWATLVQTFSRNMQRRMASTGGQPFAVWKRTGRQKRTIKKSTRAGDSVNSSTRYAPRKAQ